MTKNEDDTEVEQLLKQAESRVDRKDYHGAIKIYNRLLDIDPRDAWSYWERALIKKAQNDIQGAVKDLNTAIDLEPGNSFAYVQRGLIREKSGDRKGAEADFDRARRIREENPPEKQIPKREKKEVPQTSKEKDGRSALDYASTE